MIATIKDIKEADKLVCESIRKRIGKGTYSDRMEMILLNYENIKMNGLDCIIRLNNGFYESIYDYIK